jgi:hypothetical protein
MAAPTTFANAEGGVYELVARGNKDAYFFQDFPDSKFIFDNSYQAQAPFSKEIRRVPPKAAAEFGRTIDFDIDVIGDILQNPTFFITLPSWLPVQQQNTNRTSILRDTNGNSYGYTNNIAYFLFERIQFFQDNILLQEFSGDTLWAMNADQGTYGSTFVTQVLTGGHDGSVLSIQRNATPGSLRLELPLIGCQEGDPGFPLRSVTRHAYRLRCKLRKLEDLVESSNTTLIKPAPWGKQFVQTLQDDTEIPFNTLRREEIGPLSIFLETTQVYVSREIQEEMETNPQKLPFKRHFENIFSQNNADYINVLQGGTSVIKRRLDGRHPTARLLWYFRSFQDQQKNKLWKIQTDSGKSYYNTLSLQIAGQTRELPRSSTVWRDVVNYGKEQLDSGIELSTMNFTIGDIAPKRFPEPPNQQPNGTINMTTADRPTFYIELANPETTPPITQLYVITEGWAQFQTDGKGRAELFSQN